MSGYVVADDIGVQRRKQRASKAVYKQLMTDCASDLVDPDEIVDIVVEAYAPANDSELAYDYKVAGDALRESRKVTW